MARVCLWVPTVADLPTNLVMVCVRQMQTISMENRWKMVEVCGILVAGAFLERVRVMPVMPFVSISIAGERSTEFHRCGDLQRWERCPNGIPTISWTIRAATEQGVRAWACRKKSVESFDYAWHCLTAGFAQPENSTGSSVRCCQRTNCPHLSTILSMNVAKTSAMLSLLELFGSQLWWIRGQLPYLAS